MADTSLFTIPDGNDDGARARRPVPAAQPTPKPTQRFDPIEHSPRPSDGLDQRYEYSTGYSMAPRAQDEVAWIPESRAHRVRLGVVLALVAVVVVLAIGSILVFAAAR